MTDKNKDKDSNIDWHTFKRIKAYVNKINKTPLDKFINHAAISGGSGTVEEHIIEDFEKDDYLWGKFYIKYEMFQKDGFKLLNNRIQYQLFIGQEFELLALKLLSEPTQIRGYEKVNGSQFTKAIQFILSIDTKTHENLYFEYFLNDRDSSEKVSHDLLDKKIIILLSMLGHTKKNTKKFINAEYLTNYSEIEKLSIKAWASIAQYCLLCRYMKLIYSCLKFKDSGECIVSINSLNVILDLSSTMFLSGHFNQFKPIIQVSKNNKGKTRDVTTHNSNFWMAAERRDNELHQEGLKIDPNYTRPSTYALSHTYAYDENSKYQSFYDEMKALATSKSYHGKNGKTYPSKNTLQKVMKQMREGKYFWKEK